MGRPRCANAWRGCPGEARPKRKTDPELCVRCMKSGRGRVLMRGEGGNRWGMTCANASKVVGAVLGCRGRLYKREEHRGLCAPCFMGKKGAPSDRQRRWALAKREYRRQKRQERTQKEVVVPEVIKLHVLTVQSNFARLTFHGVKRTHVEINGILAGREGDYVAMRVSKRAKKTCFAEYIEKGSESKLCDASEKCGCNERGHIVGIVRLGQTHKVCRKKAGEDSWLRQTCCRLNDAHIFVTELTRVERLETPYPFSDGNLVPVLGCIPTRVIPAGIVQDCVRSAEELQERLELEKCEKRKRLKSISLCLCGPEGARQNCERCGPVKGK